MERDCGNIYKTGRAAAGLTQERWAEMLGVSVDSVRKYESGVCIPGDDVVARMAEISGMSVLGYWHLKNKSAIANDLLPELEIIPLSQAVVKLLSELEDIRECELIPKLLKLAKDGVIDGEERPYFDNIINQLEDIVRAVLAVKYSQWRGGADEHGRT